MNPIEFELLVKDYLETIGKGLEQFKITHNKKIQGSDGTYQIDILASFKALDGDIKVLVECKQYTQAISREKVQILYDKLRSVGAQKGMLFATSPFQTGAVNYASQHGISLVQVVKIDSNLEDGTSKNTLSLYRFINGVVGMAAGPIGAAIGIAVGSIASKSNKVISGDVKESERYYLKLHLPNDQILNEADTYVKLSQFLIM